MRRNCQDVTVCSAAVFSRSGPLTACTRQVPAALTENCTSTTPLVPAMRAKGGGTGRRPFARSGTPASSTTSRTADAPDSTSGGIGGGGGALITSTAGGGAVCAKAADWAASSAAGGRAVSVGAVAVGAGPPAGGAPVGLGAAAGAVGEADGPTIDSLRCNPSSRSLTFGGSLRSPGTKSACTRNDTVASPASAANRQVRRAARSAFAQGASPWATLASATRPSGSRLTSATTVAGPLASWGKDGAMPCRSSGIPSCLVISGSFMANVMGTVRRTLTGLPFTFVTS